MSYVSANSSSSSACTSASTTPPETTTFQGGFPNSLFMNNSSNSGLSTECHLITIDDNMIHKVIHALGLIPSQESYHTVKLLLETLRYQCGNSEYEPIAAEKASSALKALLSANEHEVMVNMAAAEGAPSRNL